MMLPTARHDYHQTTMQLQVTGLEFPWEQGTQWPSQSLSGSYNNNRNQGTIKNKAAVYVCSIVGHPLHSLMLGPWLHSGFKERGFRKLGSALIWHDGSLNGIPSQQSPTMTSVQVVQTPLAGRGTLSRRTWVGNTNLSKQGTSQHTQPYTFTKNNCQVFPCVQPASASTGN